jgi:hypothetical protein
MFLPGIVSAQTTFVYKGRYGYDPIAHYDDGVFYAGRYGYNGIVHYDGGFIYKGRYGYDALAHIEGEITIIQLFAIILLYFF